MQFRTKTEEKRTREKKIIVDLVRNVIAGEFIEHSKRSQNMERVKEAGIKDRKP